MPRRSQFDMNFSPASFWAASGPGGSAVEIARFAFKLGPLNQVRLLARPVKEGVGYQIGKGVNQPYNAAPASTPSPLNFAGLIDMAEDGIRPSAIRHFNSAGRTTEELVSFVEASSGFYPELRAWYAQEAREWATSRRVYAIAKMAVYAAMAVAAVLAVARAGTFDVDLLDAVAFAFFGMSVLSLAWATDRRRCLSDVARWLIVGGAAFVVAQGFSLPYCASLIAGGAFLFLIVGLALDFKNEAYRPLRRYRFAGIGHPNWQAESCLVLLFSTAYLHSVGFLPSVAWALLLVFTVTLLVLTRSRAGFWVAVVTAVVWTGLELSFSLRPTGLLTLLALAAIAAALVRLGSSPEPVEIPSNAVSGTLEKSVGQVVHLGRDKFSRRNFGGRTGLWRFVLEAVRKKPFLGYGHGVFWTPAREQEALRTLRWSAGSSHSIYLDTILNCGLAGLALFLVLMATATGHALGLPAPDAVFLISFFFLVAVEGLFESAFLMPNFRSFALFLLIFAMA